MKVMIVKEVMTGDVSPVAMFKFYFYFTNSHPTFYNMVLHPSLTCFTFEVYLYSGLRRSWKSSPMEEDAEKTTFMISP